ncbi:ribokinase [Agromyces lapidis]|uniref:Ribokinase n=1 Tax=Agromyces lapidis TaxID=279574 RepID=A0ABV5SL30_9MICO|nr:ribokinase [Agromyces lapidis]
MARGARVVVVGSLNVDATSYVERFPAPGETVTSRAFRTALGGKGANQAVAAHLAGAEVDLVARLGDDANAALALGVLERLGLATAGIGQVADAPTGVAQITVADSGENTVIVTGGANLALDPESLDTERERLASAALVLSQGELPIATIERLVEHCAALGVRLVVNLAPPVAVSAAALAVCDPLVVNEHEARAIGIGAEVAAGAPLDEWRPHAASAVGRVARSVVVTLGAAGAVGASPEGDWAEPAPEVVAVDTTGAGDCFTGTLAAFLAEGRGLAESMRIAVAAGALAVQARGTVDSYAPRATVLAAAALDDEGAPLA